LGAGSPAKAAEAARQATAAMALERIFMTETPFGVLTRSNNERAPRQLHSRRVKNNGERRR
jgi:hypothetical protein